WESRRGLELALARDGRSFGPPRLVARATRPLSLGAPGWCPLAQRRRCVTLNPALVTTRGGGVVLTWAARAGRSRRVFAARFDSSLARIGLPRLVAPTASPSDQFLPASTVDVSTGTVWVCF